MSIASEALRLAESPMVAEAALETVEGIGCSPLVRFLEENFSVPQLRALQSSAVKLPNGFPKLWGTTSTLSSETPQVFKGYESLGLVRSLSVRIADGTERITAENPEGLWASFGHSINPVKITAQGPRAYVPGAGGHFSFEFHFPSAEPARVPVTTLERNEQFVGNANGPLIKTERIAEATRIVKNVPARPYQSVTEYSNPKGLFDFEDRPRWPSGGGLQIQKLGVWDQTRLPAYFVPQEPIPVTEIGMGGVKRTRMLTFASFL